MQNVIEKKYRAYTLFWKLKALKTNESLNYLGTLGLQHLKYLGVLCSILSIHIKLYINAL